MLVDLGPLVGAADGRTNGFLGVVAGAVAAGGAVAVLKRNRLASVAEALCCTAEEVLFVDRMPSALVLFFAMVLDFENAVGVCRSCDKTQFRKGKVMRLGSEWVLTAEVE